MTEFNIAFNNPFVNGVINDQLTSLESGKPQTYLYAAASQYRPETIRKESVKKKIGGQSPPIINTRHADKLPG
jgi:hypothetical protein